MTGNDKDHGRSRRPGAEDRGWSHMSGTQWSDDREVGWRCVQSVPCTWRRGARISWLSLKTKVDGFSVVWPQNHWDCFLWFGLKTSGNGFFWFDLKTSGDGFLWFGLKTGYNGFSLFGLKTGGRFLGWVLKLRWWRVFWFWPQNQQLWFGDFGLKIIAAVSWFGQQN
jgi:hypothetical protein